MGESGKVRLGIVGLGGHGRTIQAGIANCDLIEVVSVCDTSEAEVERSTAAFECFGTDSFDTLLERGGIDAIAINTPNHLHLDQVSKALNAGLHVLVEKPIANTMADGLAMVELAEKNNRLLMVGHHMRYNRAARKVKELLDSGDCGSVVTMEMHFSANNTPHIPPDAWRLQPEYCPLLPVTQLGIHGIDLVHFLMSRVSDVFASARSVTVRAPIVDSVTAVMSTEDGPVVMMTCNYCTPVLFECRFAMTKRNIVFTPHSVAISPENGMEGSDSDWESFDYKDDRRDGYDAEICHFADAILNGTPLETDGRAGLQALAVDECMRYSIDKGARVAVPDFVTPVGS